MPVRLDTTAAVDRFLALTAIPGRSGQEQQVADAVVDQLRAAGAPDGCIAFDDAHLRTPLQGGPGNLIVRLPGTAPGPTTLLSAHLDTVHLPDYLDACRIALALAAGEHAS